MNYLRVYNRTAVMASHQANRVTLYIRGVVWNLSRICLYIVQSPQQVGHSLFLY